MAGTILENGQTTEAPTGTTEGSTTDTTKPAGTVTPTVESGTQPATGDAGGDATKPSGTTEPVPGGDTPADVPPAKTDGPVDWQSLRAKVAGEDEKLAKMLGRYSTLEEALRGGVEAQRMLGANKALKPLPENPSEEELAAYREVHGIPATPQDYKIELPDGLVLGDADKPIADRVTAVAHKHNVSPAALNAIIAEHLSAQEEILGEQVARDTEAFKAAQQQLKAADGWGREFDGNVNLINGMLSAAPAGVKENLLGARLADGTELANHPDTLKWLASVARTVNPQITVDVPGNGSIEDLNTEIARLYKLSGDNTSEYWKGPLAQQNQDRYRNLLAERERLTSRQK